MATPPRTAKVWHSSGDPTTSGTVTTGVGELPVKAGDLWFNTDDGSLWLYRESAFPSTQARQLGSAAVRETRSPTDLDDSYVVGTLWINTSGLELWVCVDNTPTDAVWWLIPT